VVEARSRWRTAVQPLTRRLSDSKGLSARKLLLVSDALGTPAYPRGIFQYTAGLLPIVRAAGWCTVLVIEVPKGAEHVRPNAGLAEESARIADIYQYLSGSHYRSGLREPERRRRFLYKRRAGLRWLEERASALLWSRFRPEKVMTPNQPERLAFIPEKLRHLSDVEAFVPFERFYTDSVMRAVYGVVPPRIDARAFDAVIVDTPLYVAFNARPDVPIVGVIHDLVPIQDPTIGAGWRRLFMRKLEALIDAATHLVFVSETTRDECERQFPGLLDRTPSSIVHPVSRTYLSAIAMTGAPERSASMSAAYQRPYFFAIVSFEQRKNATVLVQAWERIGPRADLVLIGQTDESFSQQLNERSVKSIRTLGLVSDAVKTALIRGARAVLVPSHAEGFGIPIVEGALLGAPVICSDIPVFREITGGFARFFDPYSADSLVRAVEALLNDPSAASADAVRLREHCLERYSPGVVLPVLSQLLRGA
jgi:glycosyltransferase involved in cell wall biosynthesis